MIPFIVSLQAEDGALSIEIIEAASLPALLQDLPVRMPMMCALGAFAVSDAYKLAGMLVSNALDFAQSQPLTLGE